MDHMVIAVMNTKLFINKKLDEESYHYSINSGSNMSQLPPHRTVNISVPRLNISRANLFLWILIATPS